MNVFVSDLLPKHMNAGRASTSAGKCSVRGRSVTCSLGQLRLGKVKEIHVSAIALRVGRVTNRVAVTTSTPTTTLNGMTANARAVVVAKRLRFTG